MKRIEQTTQISIAQYLRLAMPRNVVWWHCPNGFFRTKTEAALAKAMGQRAGVADLCFILPPNGRAGFIEVKSPDGRLSPSQADFRDDASLAGACWAECRSLEDVIATLRLWGVELRASVAA